MNNFPCYEGGQDCPRRAVGCRADCQPWKDAQERHQAKKAAQKPSVVEEYRAHKTHDDLVMRQHRKGGLR